MIYQEAKQNRLAAKEAGHKTYSGRPCKVCGSDEKYVSNNTCKPCTQLKTSSRSPDVYRKYIKSDKGRKKRTEYRKTETYRAVQRRWSLLSGYHRQQQHRRRAIMYDSLASMTDEEFNRVMCIYKEAARLTKETGVMHHVDHIVPLVDSGTHHPDNLQILIEHDHHAKTARENKERLNG